ncbi:MAG: type II toxin-antitoxin system RelE/ParE family toxin [Rhodospirillales bacterium]|nr:type II toxin-antitoxin system RelE/ParE family toxin [Rhodospirillales bacterium]
MVVLTARAEADLEAIGDHIAADNPLRAASFVRELRDRCEALAIMPRAFPLVPRYETHRIRRRVWGNYLLFYRIETDRIVVLHVLHGATDYAALLFPD